MTDTAARRPVALVTGAGRRIGRAIAEALAGAGYRVALHYGRSGAEASALAAALDARHGAGTAVTVQADLRGLDCDALLGAATRALGPLRVLVNNASLFEPDTALSADRQSWAAHMETNLETPFRLAQAFARQLPPDGDGSIVNILDQRVLALRPDFFSYTLSKAALWALTRMLAQALAPRIRVNGVGPGPVLPSIHQSAEDFGAEVEATLLKRATPPEEIAAAVLFVVQASSLTGQMVALDAGQHLMPYPDHP